MVQLPRFVSNAPAIIAAVVFSAILFPNFDYPRICFHTWFNYVHHFDILIGTYMWPVNIPQVIKTHAVIQTYKRIKMAAEINTS